MSVVLREHEVVAALPSVVRSVRHFAETPLLSRLKHAMLMSPVCTATIALLLAQNSEDLRLEALKSGRIETQPLTSNERCLPADQTKLVNDVLLHGAEHGSVQVVEWALRTSSTAKVVVDALRTAIFHGQLAIVQLLYPRMDKCGSHAASKDEPLLTSAASYGHLEVLQWIYANRRNANARFDHFAWMLATRGGHLEVLKWLHANSADHFFTSTRHEAILNGQRDVLGWIREVRPPADASYAMKEVARRRNFEMLAWLHERYPTRKISSWALNGVAYFGVQFDVVRWLLTHFPDRYADEGVVTGAYSGDLEATTRFAVKRFPTRSDVKRAMFAAAKYGHFDILQWLSRFFDEYYIPVRVLWHALFRGHLGIVRWVMEQTPRLFTQERLAEVHEASMRQLPSNVDPNGDIREVTRWIQEQQQGLRTL